MINTQWAYFYPPLDCTFDFKTTPKEFLVEEILGFVPSGEGEHAFLYIQKQNLNTMSVVERLALCCGVKTHEVGFSGLKDKYAVTRQWMSVPHKAIADKDISLGEGVDVFARTRHARKLKRGVHRSNRFEIVLKNLTGNQNEIEARLDLIKSQGVPNYFGAQRFGFRFANVEKGIQLLRNELMVRSKNKQNLYVSSVKSALFNDYLSQRIQASSFDTPLAGDVFALSGSHSIFTESHFDDVFLSRLNTHDISIAAPLLGIGDFKSQFDAQVFESEFDAQYETILNLLVQRGERRRYRAMRLVPEDFEWVFKGTGLCLSFVLPSGTFATAVLRELGTVRDLSNTTAQN